jgi:lipopolysaccharide export system permease protein
MNSISRYIFRSTLSAFFMVLVSLTAIIWVTQALRDIDLMTSQGQTILVFLGITSLVIPQLIMVIAPVALVIAVAYVLNRLTTDSEIIVMNAAGMSPWRLFRAVLLAALVVVAIVTLISAYLSPKCVRELRRWAAEVRADLVTRIVQPGRFVPIEPGLIFHLRERLPNGQLLGLFISDERDPKEKTILLAEQGEIVQSDSGTFLVLANGSLQRREPDKPDPTIVQFDRHAFDLSQFSSRTPSVGLTPRELYLWELMGPPADESDLNRDTGRLRAELHDRIAAPVYPLAFAVIAFCWMGAPRTLRQSRTFSMVAMVLTVLILRLVGFASIVIGIYAPIMLSLQYIALAAVVALSLLVIGQGIAIELPAGVARWLNAVTARIARRFASA